MRQSASHRNPVSRPSRSGFSVSAGSMTLLVVFCLLVVVVVYSWTSQGGRVIRKVGLLDDQATPSLPLLTHKKPPTIVLSMSVKRAYRAIPHRQTTFSITHSRLSSAARNYLRKSFRLIDQGVSLRVSALLALRRGRSHAKQRKQYKRLIRFFANTSAPAKLRAYHNVIRQALQWQLRFFQRASQRSVRSLRRSPQVHRSSALLKKAYGLLMGTFRKESAINKRAFFDHLCALDFI